MQTHREFEMFARDYLKRHPGIDREWRHADERTDLVCARDSNRRVFATLRRDKIAVGDTDGHIDFADPEGVLSRQKLAARALAHLIKLLVKNGHVENTGS